jgi:hypothetical protein
MQSTGVLALVIPENAAPEKLASLIARGAPADPLLRTAALLTGNPAAFAARLKLSTEESEILRAYAQPNALTPAADDAALRRALADTATETLIARTWLAQTGEADWDDLRTRLAATPRPVFPLQGRDLTAMGIAPGPMVGEILLAVRRWWLDGGCTANKAACRDRASKRRTE